MANTSSQLFQVRSETCSTVDFLQLHQLLPERYPFLLESVAHGALGRYDILFAFPQDKKVLSSAQAAAEFLANFNHSFESLKCEQLDSDLPFTGGWFGYFSYDYAQVVEPSLSLPVSQLPLAILVRVPAAIIYDHQTEQIHFITEMDYSHLLDDMQHDFQRAKDTPVQHQKISIQQHSEEPEKKYLDGIKAIKEYILAGDIFQVNLSREWQLQLENDDYVSLYQSLRENNPAPFAACVNWGDWQILSSSPERLVRYQAPWVETRPIAGTRKRSKDDAADKALIEELISHPKEIAEHIMLIDLERNDLGRICQPGSVEVNELMVVETYEHVHHIVSNVRGHLKDKMSPLEIIHATFPGGTITGCPKIRCMEIIAELEKMPRQAYTGSLGYINRDGSLDFNILIRTILKEHNQVSFRAGAGIVADSIPERELEESRHKAKGMLNALTRSKKESDDE
ncbi:aminodeoxychorismate synthase component I [Hydrogenovibrio sp. 3SP14C1]|uniref:aminodeoxychorismate synthase component I n=1 Tax=Hydrogenovibrio sp. 3SP14C1 TaxID=3038774 RepID=UPI002417613A|nr:aminodeoxychorismate synthase component I [Hydrogenovibrio sp. 3SP14C1]MDG4813069.1 aminodeoxychorismate synthase component I [Hydrogenovibrio sp. 3SP14C1]